MKRIAITLIAALLTACCLWAREEEVVVTRQLTTGQRSSLPEKTIAVEMKRLVPSKKADPGLIDAITQVMDTIASEDYLNRTFVLLLEPRDDGETGIAVRDDDIVTRGIRDASVYHGTLEHSRHHFVVLEREDNAALIDRTFKRQGKVTFVQEFEFVDFKTPHYPTNVIATWSPLRGLRWESVLIDDDPLADRDRQERPSRIQD